MNDVQVLITEEDIDAALADAADLPPEITALTAVYDAEYNVVLLGLSNKRRLIIPREELQGLQDATPEQLANIQIFGGDDIAWPDLDVDHYLPHLLRGRYATEKWTQAHFKPVTTTRDHPVAA